jgi:hypothetical protein
MAVHGAMGSASVLGLVENFSPCLYIYIYTRPV